MANDSLGLIELTSIASGFLVCDAMLKAAAVSLVLSRSICSGKYMVMVRGDVAAVQAAVSAGIAGARFSVIDSFVIPNLHEAVFPAISASTKVEALEALGIVESFSVASLIEGADAAVKAGFTEILVMLMNRREAGLSDPRKQAEDAAGLLPRLRALG